VSPDEIKLGYALLKYLRMSTQHRPVSKYNVIGVSGPGEFAMSLRTDFLPNEKQELIWVWDELKRQRLISATGTDMVHPDDWITVTSKGQTISEADFDAMFTDERHDRTDTEKRGSATSDQSDDWKFAKMAVEEARKSISESADPPNPKVGAVVVKDGKVLTTAHRGELAKSHAEYIALERKLENESLAGATVYTTLEPCTSRGPDKIPCAERLVARKVARVVMGMLDPDERVHGRGQMNLRKADIATDFFPKDLMKEVEELNRDFTRDRESRAKRNKTEQSPLEIIFDATNPGRRFWSVESVKDGNGTATGESVWECRVEIKNKSSQTLKDVLVTREHIGGMPRRPSEVVFDRTNKNYCDINPHTSELVRVLRMPIPLKQPGMLSSDTALEYGPIKLVASAADALPAIKTFEFDYQKDPMLREVTVASTLNESAPSSKSALPQGKIHFVPDRHTYGWSRNEHRLDVRVGGTFTYDGTGTLVIVDAFVTDLKLVDWYVQSLNTSGKLVTRLAFQPHEPQALIFNLINEPTIAELGKPQAFRIALLDVYNRVHELDSVVFPWIGPPASNVPPPPSREMWESLSHRFKTIDVEPLIAYADWIYTIETQTYEWTVRHRSDVATKMTIELCKEGGKMLTSDPEFRTKFPHVASINDDGDRWLVAIYKVANLGKVSSIGTSVDASGTRHAEGGNIRDLPGASQVLCQMAINRFSE
jgi:pyrimidine deaminase RibD-like protein